MTQLTYRDTAWMSTDIALRQVETTALPLHSHPDCFLTEVVCEILNNYKWHL